MAKFVLFYFPGIFFSGNGNGGLLKNSEFLKFALWCVSDVLI